MQLRSPLLSRSSLSSHLHCLRPRPLFIWFFLVFFAFVARLRPLTGSEHSVGLSFLDLVSGLCGVSGLNEVVRYVSQSVCRR